HTDATQPAGGSGVDSRTNSTAQPRACAKDWTTFTVFQPADLRSTPARPGDDESDREPDESHAPCGTERERLALQQDDGSLTARQHGRRAPNGPSAAQRLRQHARLGGGASEMR